MTTMTLHTALACIETCIKANKPTFLHGPPGVGKSQGYLQLTQRLKMGFIDIRASQREPMDLRGAIVPDMKTKTTIVLPPSELPQVDRDGETGILLLDELNTASQAVQTACYQLIQERAIGDYKLPDGWVPCAAGNRMIDRASAQRMPTALRNRFAHFTVEADAKTFCDWGVESGRIPAKGVAFLRWRPGLIHIMPKGDENAFPTPRSWEHAFAFADAPKELRVHLFSSLVGDGPAAELEGFLRVYESLPSIEDIIANPKSAILPPTSEPAALFAVAGACARFATRDNIKSMLTYAERLPAEFYVLCGLDIAKRDPALKSTSAFAAWAAANSKVML
jgi:hypothetical protein